LPIENWYFELFSLPSREKQKQKEEEKKHDGILPLKSLVKLVPVSQLLILFGVFSSSVFVLFFPFWRALASKARA
jgi:hypothetical protein